MLVLIRAALLATILTVLWKMMWLLYGFGLLLRVARIDALGFRRARNNKDRAIIIAQGLVQQITLLNWRLRRSVDRLRVLHALTDGEQTIHYTLIDHSMSHTWCDGRKFELCLPTLIVSKPLSSIEVAKEYRTRMDELSALEEALRWFDHFFGQYYLPTRKTP